MTASVLLAKPVLFRLLQKAVDRASESPRRSLFLALFCTAMACPHAIAAPRLGDLDNDGRDDVLLRRSDTGSWIYYGVDTSRATSTRVSGVTANLDYRLVGIGRFEDREADQLLLRHTENGSWIYYSIDGNGRAALRRVGGATRNVAYDVVGVGDLDGDEFAEVLLRHVENGSWISYSFDGGNAQLVRLSGVTTSLSYGVRGLADLDGDGVDDLLLRHAETGEWIYYVTDGRTAVLRRLAGATRNLDYVLAGTGDFDGDGRHSVLLRHRGSGGWISFGVEGGRARREAGTGGVTSNQSYRIVGIGDLDGDLADEVLLRHDATGAWIYYDVGEERTTLHRVSGVTTNRVWRPAGTLRQANEPPVADPGPDVEADERTMVLLDGSGSSDPDGAVVSYLWEQLRGPSVELPQTDSMVVSFSLPDLAEDTYFIFRLTVTDDDGALSEGFVIVLGRATEDDTSFSGGGQVSPTGGDLQAGDLTIMIPSDVILGPIQIDVTETDVPERLPLGLRQVDDAFDIQVSEEDQERINGPLKVRVAYDDAGMTEHQVLLPLHFEDGEYRPVRILSVDPEADTITFESRSFSTFVLATFDEPLPEGHEIDFSPSTHGWRIANQGDRYFTPGGNCLGMSGYAVWYFNNRSDSLYGLYSADVAQLVATRAHLAQSQTWAIRQWRAEQALPEASVIATMKGYLRFLDAPLILLMGTGGEAQHASVVYGYDDSGFVFYDVNTPDGTQRLPYDDGFGTYGTYDSFGFVAVASLGRTEDFADLAAQAAAGFVHSDEISVTSPRQDEVVSGREATVSGSLDAGLVGRGGQLILTVRGSQPRIISVGSDGSFSESVEVSNGTNTLVFLAGVDIRNQSNWYKNSATLIRTFEGDVPVTHLLATLTWDQEGTDVDLYITEPAGETMWFANKTTSNGLTLDFDDRDGFGPEHGTLNEMGTVLDGSYSVRVHYYSDRGREVGASGRVNLVIREGLADQLTDTIRFSIATDDSGSSGPGNTGPAWAEIADVDIANGRILRTSAPAEVITRTFRLREN